LKARCSDLLKYDLELLSHNGYGTADLVTGPDVGGGPHVRVFGGSKWDEIGNFMAGDSADRNGIRVGTVEEVDGTAADVLTGAGPTGAPVVRRYDGPTLNLESAALAFAGGMTAGVFVGGNVPVPPAPSIFINAPFPGDYREGTCPTTPGDEMDDTVNPEAGSLSDGGVRPIDGSVNIVSTDFSSGGFGSPWGFSRSFANNPGYVGDEANGRGWVNNQLPFLREDSKNNRLFAVQSGTRAFVFDETVGVYTAHFDGLLTMDHDTTNHRFVLTDVDGRVQTYYDFDSSHPSAQQGTLASYTDAEGNVSTVNRNGSGVVTSVGRSFTVSSTTYAESYVYTYYTSGVNADRLSSVALQRTVGGGSPTTIRTATYTYYDGSESYGLVGQLKTAVVADGSSNTLETSYYRYYETSQANGYDGGLRFVLGPTAYAQMVGDGYTPTTATDSQLDDYADHYFEYDADQRVTTHVVAGAGCSACTGGQGTYTYAYTDGANAAGYNSWAVQTVETLPDGSTNTYYSNAYGQVMLKSFVEAGGSDEWITFTMFDAAGRPLWEAAPSAMTGYDDAYADLVHVTSGNAAYVADSTGLVTAFTYDTTTTATTSTAGAAAGYLSGVDIQRGETGTAVPQSDSTFIKRTVGSIDLFFPAASTQYRNDNGTGGQTTSVAYTWQSGTFAPESITTTLPTVTTAQNGPNSATSMVTVFDSKGQPTWSKDPGGFLTYTEFDNTTGAVTKQITDVDTTQTGTFANLPSGWSTPGGGGLHLTTSYEVDALGRTTKVTYPNGRVDYTVFNDANHEVRYYPGWNSGTNLPTGPTTVSRDDRAGGYAESLTMSATPNVSSGRPTGTESIGSLQSLSRSYRNEAGQVVHSDAYFNLSGLTYSTAADIGTLNTHYYRTAYKTSDRGWAEKTTSPLGTITRQVYDDLGRVVSEWIGTDDTPTSGYWSPSNTSGTDLVVVREYEYDGGGVGDGNLTKVTEHPGLSQADRVTEFFYDWRNRQVAVKAGVEGSESTSLNRPISYTDYDNLGEVTKTRTYDGDAVTITSTGGVPNAPSSSLLRSQSTASYDELGRVYLSEVYTVDPSSGSVGSYTLKSNSWFDARGQVIKSSQPGGLVQKMAYDGAGRVTTSYTTDGGGDSGYGDADDVTGDNVLEQSETAYDSSGNVLSTTSRQRFHDETGTGALGTPTTGNHARVSYAAYYYDLADRPTATADYGTNGASSWTRASTVPTRSDTILVVSQTYDAAGRTYETTDPRGLVNRTTYDAFGRTTKTVENYVDGTVSDGDDKTTEYAYNAAGMTTLTAKLTGGGAGTIQVED
jgi:YD repeat-containing protein